MSDLSLVVLAAGIGSRFGGLKQVAAVDARGQTLADYSIFDAVNAGFRRVVCVVTAELEAEFHSRIGRHVARQADLVYAHQRLDDLPSGYGVPHGRVKPWGTGQAVLAALPYVNGSFATINADDFYGRGPYHQLAAFLSSDRDTHGLVGYHLRQTLSDHGTVSRGVCEVKAGRLVGIDERTALRRSGDGGAIDEAGQYLGGDTIVSMNLWGFRPSAKAVFAEQFRAFLDRGTSATSEYYLPDGARGMIGQIAVLETTATWLGITYAGDLEPVRDHLARLVAQGDYPERLWP
ncbi:MAG: NTP transferase domain-containing protein [Propionibacteriaceae bacterium]|jgi:NDP-sugar pyrophosphorylase family protein|nr:NTP transferase domain-containing protein [Propionibacteriaceae bacterium]